MPRLAIKTATQRTAWPDILQVWQTADQIDMFESAWNFDHFYPLGTDQDGPCLESWTTLAALAQATSRIRIGSMVHGMHFRHPAVTANMAATLDIISGGRLNLGLGAGWYQPEVRAYGMDLGTVNERMTRFEEGVEVIHRLLTEEVTDFEGELYRLSEARCNPKPIQRPRPPIAIGGRGRQRTLKIVAKYASIWDASFVDDPILWLDLRDALLDHCAAVGRDPNEIQCSANIAVAHDADPGEIALQTLELFGVGLDLVVLNLTPPHRASLVEALAKALDSLLD